MTDTSGPSKEELQGYWNSSRAYFDELAQHYKKTDPEYYNKFIAPFYSSPFSSVSSQKTTSRAARSILVSVFGFIAILVAGIAVFFMQSSDSLDEKLEKVIEPADTRETKPIDKDNGTKFFDNDFITGSKYLAEKDYDKAEEHLKKVKPESPNYKEAQQLLESIELLKKYDK